MAATGALSSDTELGRDITKASFRAGPVPDSLEGERIGLVTATTQPDADNSNVDSSHAVDKARPFPQSPLHIYTTLFFSARHVVVVGPRIDLSLHTPEIWPGRECVPILTLGSRHSIS